MPHFPSKGERPPWRATVLTLFPEMFPGPLGISLVGQALEAGLWSLRTVPIREFGLGRQRAQRLVSSPLDLRQAAFENAGIIDFA